MRSRAVAEVVVHKAKPVPTYALALGLPLPTYDPPSTSRCTEKAKLKSATLDTSQSLISSHLAVAAVVSGKFWTQSGE